MDSVMKGPSAPRIFGLEPFLRNWNLFMQCIVTGSETHHYDPDTKQQSMQ